MVFTKEELANRLTESVLSEARYGYKQEDEYGDTYSATHLWTELARIYSKKYEQWGIIYQKMREGTRTEGAARKGTEAGRIHGNILVYPETFFMIDEIIEYLESDNPAPYTIVWRATWGDSKIPVEVEETFQRKGTAASWRIKFLHRVKITAIETGKVIYQYGEGSDGSDVKETFYEGMLTGAVENLDRQERRKLADLVNLEDPLVWAYLIVESRAWFAEFAKDFYSESVNGKEGAKSHKSFYKAILRPVYEK